MRRLLSAMALAGLMLAPACGQPAPEPASTTSEETMQPTDLTVAEAARETARYVSLVVGETIDPAPDRAEKIGCRTDSESLMSVGPPWRLRSRWWVDNPAPSLVDETLRRLATLTAEGFERQPWTRPDPEPADTLTYRDQRGYVVTASAATTPAGRQLLEVTASSPCADE